MNAATPVQPDRLLKLEKVREITGLGKTMIYRLIRAGSFPQPFKPGGYASRWSEDEILAWRESQRQASISKTQCP